jgi:hypothetical protein
MVCEWFGLKTTWTVFTGLSSKLVAMVSSSLASKPAATVCEWFGIKTTRIVFAGLASKPMATVSSGLASKPVAAVFSSLASKLVATVSPGLASKPVVGFLVEPQNQGGGGFPGFGPQNWQLWFGDLGLKIITTISWFGPQNQADFGLSVVPQNQRGRSVQDTCRDLAACFAWKKVWLGFPSLA